MDNKSGFLTEGFKNWSEQADLDEERKRQSDLAALDKESPVVHERVFALQQAKAEQNQGIRLKELEIYAPTAATLTQKDRLDVVRQNLKNGISRGFDTGFPSLDQITNGLIPGQTYLFFADTSVGKSLVVINILISLARSGERVVYFDLENATDFTTERLILVNEQLPKKDWMKLIQEKEHDRIDQLFANLLKLPLESLSLDYLNTRFGSITFDSIETLINEHVAKGSRIFALDHLHYFEPSDKDHNKLGDIARRLNNLAAKHNIVIMFVCHTRKGLTFEKNGQVMVKRPLVDDINGSSLISKHTKNIIGIQRNVQSTDPLDQSKATIYVDKTKAGPTGKFPVLFNPGTLTFTESTIQQKKEGSSVRPPF